MKVCFCEVLQFCVHPCAKKFASVVVGVLLVQKINLSPTRFKLLQPFQKGHLQIFDLLQKFSIRVLLILPENKFYISSFVDDNTLC